MERVRTYFTLICCGLALGCSKVSDKAEFDMKSQLADYFEAKLSEQINTKDFEENSGKGFVKIGNFLDSEIKNAIVVRYDSVPEFSIYELKNGVWKKTFSQQEKFSKAQPIQAFIEDFNFDGTKDIALKNQVSNGAGIMSFHLWLSAGNSIRYVKDFGKIGNPVIVAS